MPKSNNPLAELFSGAISSKEVQDATAETLSRSYVRFLGTAEGKELVKDVRTTVVWYTAIPVAIAAFGLGYYIATRRR